MRLGDVLIDGMENGWLVRNGYMIPERIMKDMDEESRDVASRYNEMISIIVSCRKFRNREYYWQKVLEATEIWLEIEHELPLLFPESVARILERNRFMVRYDRCIDAALAASRYRRYFTFTEILRDVRFGRSFSALGDSSVNKVLSRVLGYLEDSGLTVKTWRNSRARVDVLYFRLFRMQTDEKNNCRHCWVLHELKRVLEKADWVW
ncbi:hypothetical protein DRP04_03990 [Archaeoglobales archaeon]|nr:MAG: hypothetical protein DRP04_03990 [Archaeoglobales archaeon]